MTGNPPGHWGEAIAVAGAWVRAIVAHFGRDLLEEPTLAVRALAQTELGDASSGSAEAFAAAQLAVASALPGRAGPFAVLLRELAASPAESFLLALAFEVENHHLLGCALADLQAPAGGARPTLHLCAELVSRYFEPTDLNRLLALPVFASGAFDVRGDGPLPQRELVLDARLWAVLGGHATALAGCRFLAEDRAQLLPGALLEELPALASLLQRGVARGVVLRGATLEARQDTAAVIARELDRRAVLVSFELWQRAPAIALACRAASWLPVLEPPIGAGESVRLGVQHAGVPVVVLLGNSGAVEDPSLVELELPVPTRQERTALWSSGIQAGELAAELAASTLLGAHLIDEVARRAQWHASQRKVERVERIDVARARRATGTDGLRVLAHPVDRAVPEGALVLPPRVREEVDAFQQRCRQRELLWAGLGDTMTCTVNHGARALFVGESGTGKTLAASHVATGLGAPLYRVDLAAVMNKYVGESEKNLGRVLDLAAALDVILLFDEADAMFGARTDASEAGERYANMLTNFLLTRLENHPGVVILTSNSRTRIDPAFLRRLDAIIEFPLPGPAERVELWNKHLGGRSPGEEACCYLGSHCDLPGGAIRNAVLHAASLAQPGAKLSFPSLVGALGREYRKLGRTMPSSLVHAVQE